LGSDTLGIPYRTFRYSVERDLTFTQAEFLPEHLAKQVEDCQVDDHRAGADEVMQMYHGGTGELLQAMPTPYSIRLARRRFLRLISQGVDIQVSLRHGAIFLLVPCLHNASSMGND
jgi:hypothetical protein